MPPRILGPSQRIQGAYDVEGEDGSIFPVAQDVAERLILEQEAMNANRLGGAGASAPIADAGLSVIPAAQTEQDLSFLQQMVPPQNMKSPRPQFVPVQRTQADVNRESAITIPKQQAPVASPAAPQQPVIPGRDIYDAKMNETIRGVNLIQSMQPQYRSGGVPTTTTKTMKSTDFAPRTEEEAALVGKLKATPDVVEDLATEGIVGTSIAQRNQSMETADALADEADRKEELLQETGGALDVAFSRASKAFEEADRLTAEAAQGKIDSSRLWNNMSGARKAGFLLGSAFSAIGQGLSAAAGNQQNYAQGIIDNYMALVDQDIQEQIADIENKKGAAKAKQSLANDLLQSGLSKLDAMNVLESVHLGKLQNVLESVAQDGATESIRANAALKLAEVQERMFDVRAKLAESTVGKQTNEVVQKQKTGGPQRVGGYGKDAIKFAAETMKKNIADLGEVSGVDQAIQKEAQTLAERMTTKAIPQVRGSIENFRQHVAKHGVPALVGTLTGNALMKAVEADGLPGALARSAMSDTDREYLRLVREMQNGMLRAEAGVQTEGDLKRILQQAPLTSMRGKQLDEFVKKANDGLNRLETTIRGGFSDQANRLFDGASNREAMRIKQQQAGTSAGAMGRLKQAGE